MVLDGAVCFRFSVDGFSHSLSSQMMHITGQLYGAMHEQREGKVRKCGEQEKNWKAECRMTDTAERRRWGKGPNVNYISFKLIGWCRQIIFESERGNVIQLKAYQRTALDSAPYRKCNNARGAHHLYMPVTAFVFLALTVRSVRVEPTSIARHCMEAASHPTNHTTEPKYHIQQ